MRSIRLLIVDDEPGIREPLECYLKQETNFQIHSVSDGTQAMDLLKKNNFDIVITDTNHPGPDGIVITRHIKSESIGTFVILHTGQSMETIRQVAISAGVDAFLNKPIQLKNLLQLLKSVLNESKNLETRANKKSSLTK